jgi:predicted component of type VI protein secretion system
MPTGRPHFVVRDTQAVLDISQIPQGIIGRSDLASNWTAHLDLTPHGALNMGVSRQHLQVTVQGNQVSIMDMGSANGTKINGQPLPANSPMMLTDGTEVKLGDLTLIFRAG